MGNRVAKATLIELVAVSAVAAPFVGYGLSEWFGSGVYFILGVGVFCAWMCFGATLFLGTYKRRIAARADESTADTDAPDAPASASDTS